MIKATFPEGVTAITANGLHQWDRGQILEIHGASLPAVAEVHFADQGMTVDAIVRVCDMLGGVGRVVIPDRYLTQSLPITAWIYEVGSTTGETVATVTMPIIARAKPKDAPEIPEETSDKYTELMGVVNEYFDEIDESTDAAVQVASAKIQAEIDADFDEMESALRTDMNTMHSSHVATVEAKQEAYEAEVDTFIAEHALWVPQTVTAGTFDIYDAEDGEAPHTSKTYRVWNADSTSSWGFTATAKILYTEGTASKAYTLDILPAFDKYAKGVTLRMCGTKMPSGDTGLRLIYELNGERKEVNTGLPVETDVSSALISVTGITNCELFNEHGTAVSIDTKRKDRMCLPSLFAAAHRGYTEDSSVAHSTIADFKNAIKHGYKFLETDVHVTKDGYFVLCHDATIAGLTIATSTLAELQAVTDIATLDEFLVLCKKYDAVPVLEMKGGFGYYADRERATELVQKIEKYGLADRAFITSFDYVDLLKVSEINPYLNLVWWRAAGQISSEWQFVNEIGKCKTPTNRVYIGYEVSTELDYSTTLDLIKTYGLTGIIAHTVDDETRLNEIIPYIAGFITNDILPFTATTTTAEVYDGSVTFE